MLTTTEAFRRFRSKLELTQKEQADASRRQQEIRRFVNGGFKITDDFLTGSYRRWTKTKPLKDVDIFCVLHDDERPRLRVGKPPTLVLDEVESLLAKKYEARNVSKQRRSVCVQFPDTGDEERVMSFDVVPAFMKRDHYEIPDTATASGWTETNPKIHADKATEANERFGGEWKGMIRMLKSWNGEAGKPVRPSFLLEVMGLDLLVPPFGGEYPREFMSFFSSAADRIDEEWPDPAGLGPPVSDSMDAFARMAAKDALKAASHAVRAAMNLSSAGRQGEALRAYRRIFGNDFPLS